MGLKKNVISNFILTASTILMPLITFPYITRVLSTEGLGKVFFIDSFTQYFVLLVCLGVPHYGIREIAKFKEDKNHISNLVVELVFLQLVLAFVFVFLFCFLGFYVGKLNNSFNLIKIGSLIIIANSFAIEWFFQGIEKFSFITIRSIIIKIVSVFSILFFVNNKYDYDVYYLIMALVFVCNSILNFGYFYKNYFKGFNFKFNPLKHLKSLLILFSINASLSVYVILDSIILGFLTTPADVSYYNIPLKLVKVFWMVIAGIGVVFIPRMSSLHKNNNIVAIMELMTKSINLVFLLALPFCLFCLLFPNEILIIISGAKYLKATLALQVLSFIPLVIGLCNIFGTQFLLPLGKEKKIFQATIVGLIVSLVLNFLLIPYFKFLGSAIAAISAELSVCLYVFLAARKEIKIKIDTNLLFQILLCLTLTFFTFIISRSYYKGILLIFINALLYVFFLITTQFFFKNKFLNSLTNL